jgi:LysW-gamma-L-lysine carboxypeptidase
MINDAAAVELLHEMVAIPSPSGGEQKLARHLRDRLTELSFATRIDEVGNLIAETGTGNGPTLMLLSHLDTVEHQIPVYRDETAVYGRGSVDAKGALAAMLCAASRYTDFPGTVRVVGAVEEEKLARGGHHLAATQAAPDLLLVGEPGGSDSVVLGYKGKLDLTYEVSRAATHSTNPAPKASELAVSFWLRLLEAMGPERDHGAFQRPAATLRALTATMEHALLDVDCRLPPAFDVAAFVDALADAAGDGRLTVQRVIPAVRAARGNPLARALSAAIRRTGHTPRPTLKTGTSDMNTDYLHAIGVLDLTIEELVIT